MPRSLFPSPSMILALLALVVALGGSAYAASNLINGNKLKKFSVPGNRLKKNSLTGAEINESKLGIVPNASNAAHARFADSATRATHAASADSALSASDAAHATSADKLGGLTPSAFVQGGGSTFQTTIDEPRGTGSQQYGVPGLGTFVVYCDASLVSTVTLTNATGDMVSESSSVLRNGSSPIVGASAVGNGALLVNQTSPGAAQGRYLLGWPATAPTHSADVTVGFAASDSPDRCAAVITGTVR